MLSVVLNVYTYRTVKVEIARSSFKRKDLTLNDKVQMIEYINKVKCSHQQQL